MDIFEREEDSNRRIYNVLYSLFTSVYQRLCNRDMAFTTTGYHAANNRISYMDRHGINNHRSDS